MKLLAWLESEVRPATGGARIRQTAVYDLRGLAGLSYWSLLYPFHRVVFAATLRGIARASRAAATSLESS